MHISDYIVLLLVDLVLCVCLSDGMSYGDFRGMDETCVLSLVVPKDSIKSSCNVNKGLLAKVQSLEGRLLETSRRLQSVEFLRLPAMMTEVGGIKQSNQRISGSLHMLRDQNLIFEEQIKVLEQKVVQLSQAPPRDDSVDADRMLDPIKPLLMAEFEHMRDNLMKNLEKELLEKYVQTMFREETSYSNVNDDEMFVLPDNSSIEGQRDDKGQGQSDYEGQGQTMDKGHSSDQEVDVYSSMQRDTKHAKSDRSDEQEFVNLARMTQNMDNKSHNGTYDNMNNHSEQFNKINTSEQFPVGDESIDENINISIEVQDDDNDTYVDSLELRETEKNLTTPMGKYVKVNSTSSESKSQLNTHNLTSNDRLVEEVTTLLNIFVNDAKTEIQNDLEKHLSRTATDKNMIALIVSRLTHIEDTVAGLQRNQTEIHSEPIYSEVDTSDIDNQITDLRSSIQTLHREIESPENTVLSMDNIQPQLDDLKTNIVQTLRNTFDSNIAQIEQKLAMQDKKFNNSNIFLNTMKSTLQSLDNYSRSSFSTIDGHINRLENHIRLINKTQGLDNDLYLRLEDVEIRFDDLEMTQNFADSKMDTLKDNSAQIERDTGTKFRELQQEINILSHQLSGIPSLNVTVQILDAKCNSLIGKVTTVENTVSTLFIKQKLQSGEWMNYNFTYSSVNVKCFGRQYVKRNPQCSGTIGRFVGVSLCSDRRYKIFLGNSLEEDFLDIGDTFGHGNDHCEFVGGMEENAVVDEQYPSFSEQPGFIRGNWGEEAILDTVSHILKPTVGWYECGVKIP